MEAAYMEEHKITVEPSVDCIELVACFVGDYLNATNCPPKVKWKILYAVDELFGNIARYSNTAEFVSIRCWKNESDQCFVVEFSDDGDPFNPLLVNDPVLSSKVSERPIGGLGIFISKNLVDSMTYEYYYNKNILTIIKFLR